MAITKQTEEKIAKLDKQMEQLKTRKQALLAKERQAERKARTKRLIEVGALVESVLGELNEDDRIKLLAELKLQQDHFLRVLTSETPVSPIEDITEVSESESAEAPKFISQFRQNDDFY